MIIAENDTENVIDCCIYQYKLAKNVVSYSGASFNHWAVQTNAGAVPSAEEQYFLVIDTFFHEAFGHWVYECAVNLPLFHELKEVYPNLKLHLKSFKDYKILFCEHFGINKSLLTTELPPENTCIFPLPITAQHNKNVSPAYKAQLEVFCRGMQSDSVEKTVNILLMPRQSKENYPSNDRKFDVSDVSARLLQDASNKVLETDAVTSLQTQIDTVASSKTIVLLGGSAYLVNGMISHGARLVVLDSELHLSQMGAQPKMQYIDSLIRGRNTVVNAHRSSVYKYVDIQGYL